MLKLIGHLVSQWLSAQIAIHFRVFERMALNNRYPVASHPNFPEYPFRLYVGNEARPSIRGSAVRDGVAPWHRLLVEYGKWNSVYRRYADGCNRGIWLRLMVYMRQIQICPSCDGTARPYARTRMRRARPRKRRISPSAAVGAASAPRPHPSGSTGPSPVPAAEILV